MWWGDMRVDPWEVSFRGIADLGGQAVELKKQVPGCQDGANWVLVGGEGLLAWG